MKPELPTDNQAGGCCIVAQDTTEMNENAIEHMDPFPL